MITRIRRRIEALARRRAGTIGTGAALAGALWLGLFHFAPQPDSGTARRDVPAPLLAAVRPGPLVPEGTFTISLWRDGAWQAAGSLGADKYARTQLLVLRRIAQPGPVRVRIEKEGGGAAHLDAVLLNGQAPDSVVGAPLAKLVRADNDIANAHEGAIEAVFAQECGWRSSAILTLAGRIEPVEIGKEPVKFPLRNAYRPITAESAFLFYPVGSVPGVLTPDGDLTAERLGAPFFSGWYPNGSGHPNSLTYAWVRDDGNTLFVALDFTGDNTNDAGADYGKVYVNLPGGVREFTLTTGDARWGRSAFTYTEQVRWEHKVYEFAIPFAELGLAPGQAQGATLPLAFALYGTLSEGERESSVAYDSEQNCYLVAFSDYVNNEDTDYEIFARTMNEAGETVGSKANPYTPASGNTPPLTNVAYDPVGGKYLAIVADETVTDNWTIAVRLLDADGSSAAAAEELDALLTDGSYSDNGAAAEVAANTADGGFLAVWIQAADDDGAVFAQRVSAEGASTGSILTVSTSTYGYEDVAVQYDSVNDRYLVAYVFDSSDDISVRGRFVTASGANDGADFAISGSMAANESNLDVAFDAANERFLVVWEDGLDIKGALLKSAGGFEKDEFTIATDETTRESPAVAHDPINGGYLVVWSDARNDTAEIWGQAIDDDGAKVGGNEQVKDADDALTQPALAANSQEGGFLLSYTQETSNDYQVKTTLLGSLFGAASRSLPPGAGWALLALAGLALLLGLAKQRVPRLRPAFAAVSLALALNLLVMGGVIACSSSSGGDGETPAEEPIEPCPLE